TAVAAGEPTWLDLAADRAARHGLACVGVPTDLQLDYLGWAQVMAAVARKLAATTILVDEASRPEQFAQVAAIAELIDAAPRPRAASPPPRRRPARRGAPGRAGRGRDAAARAGARPRGAGRAARRPADRRVPDPDALGVDAPPRSGGARPRPGRARSSRAAAA